VSTTADLERKERSRRRVLAAKRRSSIRRLLTAHPSTRSQGSIERELRDLWNEAVIGGFDGLDLKISITKKINGELFEAWRSTIALERAFDRSKGDQDERDVYRAATRTLDAIDRAWRTHWPQRLLANPRIAAFLEAKSALREHIARRASHPFLRRMRGQPTNRAVEDFSARVVACLRAHGQDVSKYWHGALARTLQLMFDAAGLSWPSNPAPLLRRAFANADRWANNSAPDD
jgi:hypothetical protein